MAEDAVDFYSRLLGLTETPQPIVPLNWLGGARRTPANGIWFGDRYFSEPVALRNATLPDSPGIYAILVIDGSATPRPYRVLYFGTARSMASRVTSCHEKHSDWCAKAGGLASLYVSYHFTSGASDSGRARIEEELISRYNPECNVTYNFFADYLRGYEPRR